MTCNPYQSMCGQEPPDRWINPYGPTLDTRPITRPEPGVLGPPLLRGAWEDELVLRLQPREIATVPEIPVFVHTPALYPQDAGAAVPEPGVAVMVSAALLLALWSVRR